MADNADWIDEAARHIREQGPLIHVHTTDVEGSWDMVLMTADRFQRLANNLHEKAHLGKLLWDWSDLRPTAFDEDED